MGAKVGSGRRGMHASASRRSAGRGAGSSARRSTRSRACMAVKAEIGDSLEAFLMKATPDPKLRLLMRDMSECVRTIAFKVRTASCSATACVNQFGDEQLAVDMLADKLLFETLKYSGVCEYACSEEEPNPQVRHEFFSPDRLPALHSLTHSLAHSLTRTQDMGGEGFSVAFDPLDGSSIVDTNFTVGTIFGVWPGSKLVGVSGRDQVRRTP